MPTTKEFDDWIDGNIDIVDINQVWAAYKAVTSNSLNYFPYEVTRNGAALYLKNSKTEETLALVSDAAKEAFIKVLEYPYLDQGGIEMAKAYEDHMDHD